MNQSLILSLAVLQICTARVAAADSPARAVWAAQAAGAGGEPGADELPPLSPGTRRLPRARAPSLLEFWESYADQQQPVIIEDYGTCFADMSVANIEAVCGRKQVSVARRNAQYDPGQWAGIKWSGDGELKSVLAKLLRDADGGNDTALGVFDWSLAKHCPELLERHLRVPKFFAQDYMQRVPPALPLNYRDSWPSLFVGRNGTFGGLHKDVFGSAFWQYVVQGEKEWHIVDATDGRSFFGARARTAVAHWHDVVRPGEMVYIPGNSAHQVRNVGNTVSLAGNFISRGNLESVRAEVFKDSSPGSYYRQLQTSLLAPGAIDLSVDAAVGDMPWRTFKTQWEGVAEQVVPLTVSGAGSDEVNGEYHLAGMHGGAPQFVLRKDRRTFELFKVRNSGWWNIQEYDSTAGKYHKVHYGALQLGDGPPQRGWHGTANMKTWRGALPNPLVDVNCDSRSSCAAKRRQQLRGGDSTHSTVTTGGGVLANGRDDL
jgi:hypothetical protein